MDTAVGHRAAPSPCPHQAAARPPVVRAREAGSARRTGEQAVVANAVEPAWQDVEQEAADELVGGECPDVLPPPAVAAIVLVAERDAGFVEAEQPPVRDGNAVRVA